MLNTLVVDDEENIVKLVTHWAQKVGLTPHGFTDPLKALEFFKTRDFKLLITDIKMPGMNGHELTRRVKSLSPETEVIIITGHGDIDDAVDAIRQDAYDFIRKPFLSKELCQCLERVADKIILREENKRLVEDLKIMNKNLESQVQERTRELQVKNLELEKLDDLKSKFIACVSHELRTPLTQIDSGMFVLKTILEKKTTESEEKLLHIIQTGSKRLNSVVQHMTKILLAEHVEFQDEIFSKEVHSVGKLIQEVFSDASYFADQRKQKLQIVLPKKDIKFNLDQGKFKDILVNLTMNAIKYTPDGGEISICLENLEDAFRIVFKDNGIGISEEEKLHIFKKFYEAGDLMLHSTGTFEFKAGGLGLGLSIAKLFTEMHGGKISAESEGRDKGSQFILEFNLK